MVSPANLLKLWDIVDGTIVTTSGALFGAAAVTGLDPTCTTDEAWAATADGLYQAMRKIDDQVLLQFVTDRTVVPDSLFETYAAQAGLDDAKDERAEVFRYQRQCRADFLRQCRLRQVETFLFYGSLRGLERREFMQVTAAAHNAKLEGLRKAERQVFSALERGGLGIRKLSNGEILRLFVRWMNPDDATGTGRRVRREMPRQSEEALRKEPRLRPVSVREQLFPGNVVWGDDYVKIGRNYFKVLAAKQLPEDGTTIKFWHDFCGSEASEGVHFRTIVNLAFPNQVATKRGFKYRRRFMHSAAQKAVGQAADKEAEASTDDMEDLADELARGEKLVKAGLQIIVRAHSLAELKEQCASVLQLFDARDIELFEESLAHDLEFFKSLPAMGHAFDRWRLISSSMAADLIPSVGYARGDRHPSLQMEVAETGELFGLDLREWRRANDNFLILGASGAGKSVLICMLLAYGMLSGKSKGRVLGVDYAGETKSSFRVATSIFGGDYIPITGSGKTINPWLAPAMACEADGSVRPEILSYLSTLTNILLHNEDTDKESALLGALVQRGIRELYARWDRSEAPLYSDLLQVLKGYQDVPEIRQERLVTALELMQKFLEGPEAKLLNSRTTASSDGDFVVYDLYGLRAYEKRIRSAVAFVVTNHVRRIAFDERPDRKKYILLEEVANLLDLGMKESVEELYTTARAHGTSVGTINQEYDKYRRTGVADTINLNSTLKIFMSHQKAEGAIDPVIEDFGLNEREAEVLRRLLAVKGQYSDLLIRTSVAHGEGTRDISAKARLRLSPFDYQVVTSDAKDRAEQIAYLESYPTATRLQVLDFLAHRKRKAS